MPTHFSELSLSPDLVRVTEELGFKELTPIQAQSIPLLLSGKDLIGQAKTGSGKTVAFTIPLIQKLNLESRQIQALVLTPTRELGAQVTREIRSLGRRFPGLSVLTLCGGDPIHSQVSSLEKGVHVAVGTPGRVLDLLRRRFLDLRRVRFLVLDEGDRMLEMGFQKDMESILKEVPKDRQTVLFSATYPKSIESLSRSYQKNPVRVTLASEQKMPDIRHFFFECSAAVKLNGLLWILQQNQPESAMIFCNLKATVIELHQLLVQSGMSVDCLHGDLEQRDRDRVMAKFRNQSVRTLIATDVAARGIDVEDLDLVLNYDLPAQIDVYVHRVGRTGRAGKKGLAISLISSRERSRIQAIEESTGILLQEKTMARLENLNREDFLKNLNQDSAMATLYLDAGRKQKMRPSDILGALTGEAGRLAGDQVGKIEIHDHFSYVAVAKKLASPVLQRLREGRIKGQKIRVELVR